MNRISLAERWRAGEQNLLTLRLGETPFFRQWTEYRGVNDNQQHEFRFYWETDLRVIAGAGEVSAAGSILQTDAHFHPISYEVFSGHLPFRLATFSEQVAEVTLADQSSLTLNLSARPDLVLQHNVLGQINLFLSTFASNVGPIEATYFSPEGLVVRPVKFEPVHETPEEVKWRSSLGADLYCDKQNKILKVVIATANVSGEFEEAEFPNIDLNSLRKQRLATYQPPATITLEETAFTAPDNVSIGAVVTRPLSAAGEKYPGFLFIQGSGLHDRHGMAPGIDTGIHRIADYLTEHGHVGLRFDSRGAGNTGYGSILNIGYTTFVDDAKAAFRVLLNRSEVLANELFVIGHSLGALTAIHLALDAEQLPIKGLVLLAPPGRTFDRILMQQAMREAQRIGFTPEQMQRRRKSLAGYFRRLRETETAETERALGGLQGKAMRGVLQIDSAKLLAQVRVPVLICQGWKDIQVSVQRDTARLLRAAAENCSETKVEARVFPCLDHLFKVEATVSSPQHYYVERPTSVDFLTSILTWMNARRSAQPAPESQR